MLICNEKEGVRVTFGVSISSTVRHLAKWPISCENIIHCVIVYDEKNQLLRTWPRTDHNRDNKCYLNCTLLKAYQKQKIYCIRNYLYWIVSKCNSPSG